jgi:uncharacterized FlgJ-related protein
MKSKFKSNNFIAALIAVILIAIGFALLYAHEQSSAEEKQGAKTAAQETAAPEPVSAEAPAQSPATNPDEALSEVAQIHATIGAPKAAAGTTSEFDLARQSIDRTDEPLPRPELIDADGYDVYTNVSKDYLFWYFDQLGYTGDRIDSGETAAIPPVLVVRIRQGWSDDLTVQYKKSIFYRVLLSLVLFENDAVLRERAALLSILDERGADGSFTDEQAQRLTEMARSYRVLKNDADGPLDEQQLQELLKRVDMVPPSLALAQAAHESGYATSRFAHTANALFGQWDWGKNAVKPKQQREGMGNYGIKSFDKPIDSVRSYIMNLNTHNAYADFREVRATQRGDQQGRIVLDGKSLADTLISYSERGTEYTEELKGTISYNRLERADKLRLLQGEPIYFQGE